MKTYDVIIVGSGPAGTTAGYILKTKYNLNVLLVDKHGFPREKLCAGLTPEKTTLLQQEIFGKQTFYLSETNIVKVFYNNELITETETDIPFKVVDRTVYDNQLFEFYKSVGGEYKLKLTFKSIDLANKTVSFFNGDTFGYKYLIGADGAYSMVRRYVCPKFKKIAFIFESFIDNVTNNSIDIHFGNIENGYGWRFPHGNAISIGEGSFSKNKCTIDLFKTFVRQNGFKNSAIKGAFLPYDFVRRPAKNDIFLIGDAAGLADPITGEGIYYALLSGKMIAESIGDNFGTNKIKDNYFKKLKHVHRILKDGRKFKFLIYSPKLQKMVFNKTKGHKKVFAYACDNVISHYNIRYQHFVKAYKNRNK